ncbi:Kynurenine 3-monooxygenase [Chondrocystis sp. NIES-4102]|nr:Kynurenine 3-monooxygenase [Chondrocystis sp. NIES-4102]
MVKNITIIGAGPSGLLLALYLLKRDVQYQVSIYERQCHPATSLINKSRTFPLVINERGMRAIAEIPGLKDAVEKISLEIWGSIFHSSSGKERKTTRTIPLISLDRTALTKVFLDTLEQNYNSDRCKIYFDHACTGVDLINKQATFTNSDLNSPITVDYDLIIGADGARSQLRKSFQDLSLFQLEQKYINNSYKSINLSSISSQDFKILEPDKIHTWRIKDGTVVILVPQYDGSVSGVIHFPRNNNQIMNLQNEGEVKHFFEQNFPQVAQFMSTSEMSTFFNRPNGNSLTVRCNPYHYDKFALLIGDAAHAMSPSLGQGCNCALEDVRILNELSNEYADQWGEILPEFTKRRVSDTQAIVKLSNYTLPSVSSLAIEFMIKQRLAKILYKLFPQHFLPPLFDALNDSSIAYKDILQQYQGWVSKVKKSQATFN